MSTRLHSPGILFGACFHQLYNVGFFVVVVGLALHLRTLKLREKEWSKCTALKKLRKDPYPIPKHNLLREFLGSLQ